MTFNKHACKAFYSIDLVETMTKSLIKYLAKESKKIYFDDILIRVFVYLDEFSLFKVKVKRHSFKISLMSFKYARSQYPVCNIRQNCMFL